MSWAGKEERSMLKIFVVLGFAALATSLASASMRISEWMYQGASGANTECIEFTNVGGPAVDMTGWSVDDNTEFPGCTSLSAFGIVSPGQSVILTEQDATLF